MKSRPNFAMRGVFVAAIVALGAYVISCSNSPTSPTGSLAALSGTVLDSGGHAVSGARIVVSYPYPDPTSPALRSSAPSRLLDIPSPLPSARSLAVFNNPCSLGVMTFHIGLPDTAFLTGRIVDRNGTPRRLLFERTFQSGVYAVAWDGKDDTSATLAPDVYVFHLTEVQGDSTFNLSANVLWNPSDPTAAYAMQANSQGAFSVPLSSLANGQKIDAVDITGAPLGSFVVGKNLRVTATGPPSGIATVGATTVATNAQGKGVSVTVRLP